MVYSSVWVGLVQVYGLYLWVDGTNFTGAHLPITAERRMCAQFSMHFEQFTLHDCDTETAQFVCDTSVPRSPGTDYHTK